MPEFSAGAEHTVNEFAGLDWSLGIGDLYGTYLRNDEWFSYKLELCPSNSNTVISGKFDAWDENRIGIYGDRNISTKVTDIPFTLTIASLNNANDAFETKDISSLIAYDLYDASNTSLIPIPNAHGEFNSSSITKFDHSFTVLGAYQKVYVGFKVCSSYDDNTKTHTLSSNGNCSDPEVYEKDYILSNDPHWRLFPSSDMFAVRPGTFKLELEAKYSPFLLKSGVDYKFKISAVNPSNFPIETYSQSKDKLELNKILRFKDGVIDNDSILTGEIQPGDNNYSIQGGISRDIEGHIYAAEISFSDIGNVLISVQDSNWTIEDADDTPDTCKANTVKDGVKVTHGRFICGTINTTYFPPFYCTKSYTT